MDTPIPSPPRSTRRLILLTSLILGLLVAGCPRTPNSPSQGPVTSFHQLRFPKPDGSELAFHTLYGRVVLVDFFATSCAQCEVRIMPMLEKLYQRYQSKGFQVLGIALQPQAKEFLPPFLGVLKITYPTVIGDDTLPKGRTLFGAVSSIPRSYLLDRCGKIKHFFSGIPKRKELEAKIQSLLQQRPNCPQGG